MKQTHKGIVAVAGFCLLWALILLAASLTVYNMAGDGSLLEVEMRRYAPPEATGLPDEQYEGMGRMIADYLMERKPFFQYYYTGENEETVVCFQPHEAEHMIDCRRLIHRVGILRWLTGGAALILIVMTIPLRKYRKTFAAGMLAGIYLAAAFFLILLIWGILDFGGLFTVFHRVAFTNEGWLLNTQTDMLIRLMPTPFFVSMGCRLLLAVLAVTAVCCTSAVIVRKLNEEEDIMEETSACEAVQDAE